MVRVDDSDGVHTLDNIITHVKNFPRPQNVEDEGCKPPLQGNGGRGDGGRGILLSVLVVVYVYCGRVYGWCVCCGRVCVCGRWLGCGTVLKGVIGGQEPDSCHLISITFIFIFSRSLERSVPTPY